MLLYQNMGGLLRLWTNQPWGMEAPGYGIYEYEYGIYEYEYGIYEYVQNMWNKIWDMKFGSSFISRPSVRYLDLCDMQMI